MDPRERGARQQLWKTWPYRVPMRTARILRGLGCDVNPERATLLETSSTTVESAALHRTSMPAYATTSSRSRVTSPESVYITRSARVAPSTLAAISMAVVG